MSWQDGVAIAVVLLGLGAAAFLVVQRPSFWIEFGSRLGKVLVPLAWRYVSKRMAPDEEAAWRAEGAAAAKKFNCEGCAGA